MVWVSQAVHWSLVGERGRSLAVGMGSTISGAV